LSAIFTGVIGHQFYETVVIEDFKVWLKHAYRLDTFIEFSNQLSLTSADTLETPQLCRKPVLLLHDLYRRRMPQSSCARSLGGSKLMMPASASLPAPPLLLMLLSSLLTPRHQLGKLQLYAG
jgi:hypothetical protein